MARKKPAERNVARAASPPPSVARPVGLAALIAIFVVGATPLGLVTSFLSHDVMPKVVATLFGAAALLFLLPEWWPGLRRLWSGRSGKWLLCLAAAQAASLVISTLLSSQSGVALVGTSWRRFGMAEQVAALLVSVAAAALMAGRPDRERWLLRGMALGGGIAATYGVLQYFGFDPFLARNLYTIDYLGGIVRPPATMGHAIYFSAWLVPVALIAASLSGTDESAVWRRIALGVAILAPIAIFLSGTRGALLAMLCGGVFFLTGVRVRMKTFGAGAAIVLAFSGAMVFSPAGENLRHRFTQWKEDPGLVRLGVWRETPALVGTHLLAGTGPDTFATAFRKVESAEFSHRFPDFFHETPHNALLDAASGQGLPGALIFLALLAVGFTAKGPASLRAALAGVAAASIFASLTIVTAIQLWTLVGLLAASGSDPAEPSCTRTDDVSQAWRVPAALLGGAFVALALVMAVQDTAYARLRDAVDAGNLMAATEAFDTATSFVTGLPGYELWSSREMATLGRALGNTPDGAKAWARAAEASALAERRGEDRFSAAYQSAVLAIAAADLARGEAKSRDAIAIAPNWYKPHLLRAQILQAMARNEEAAQEFELSRKLGWAGK